MSETAALSDLEEGEIEDSDAPLETEQHVSAVNPTKMAAEELDRCVFPSQPKPSVDRIYRSTRNPCLNSSDDSSSNEDDDLELESPVKAKMHRTNKSFQENNDGIQNGASHGDAFLNAAANFQKGRSNSVWSGVVFEQSLNENMVKVSTDEKCDNQEDRGVESYNYMNKRDVLNYADDIFGDDDLYAEDAEAEGKNENTVEMKDDEKALGDEPEADIGDVESFGNTQKPNRKRRVKDRLGKRAKHSEPESRSNSPTEPREHAKSRLGNKNFRGPPKEFVCNARFDLQSKEDDAPEKVAEDLVNALGEPVYQTELFFRVVTTLGVKKSLELYYDTESIEAGGGMLIINGFRRRSPGGVFLQLVKKDKDVTKDDHKKIFPDSGFHNKHKSRKKNRNNKRMDTASDDFPLKTDAFLQEKAAGAGDSMEVSEPQEAKQTQPQETVDDLEDTCTNFELIIPDSAAVMTYM